MAATWMELFEQIQECRACGLCEARNYTVPGEGNPHATLMLVGEGPGADEDTQGRPFVGASGALLTGLLRAIDIDRKDVYIANIIKCRPPQNRTPTTEEATACLPFLRTQFALIRPRIIVALGKTAAIHVISPDIRIRSGHGQWVEKKGVWMMPTFHPSALLRDVSQKRLALADFISVKEKLKEIEHPYEEV